MRGWIAPILVVETQPRSPRYRCIIQDAAVVPGYDFVQKNMSDMGLFRHQLYNLNHIQTAENNILVGVTYRSGLYSSKEDV